VIAAKNDDPEAMVVIGFVPWMNTSCVYQDIESPNLIGFIQEFGDQGVLARMRGRLRPRVRRHGLDHRHDLRGLRAAQLVLLGASSPVLSWGP